jgi:hypothetical protein
VRSSLSPRSTTFITGEAFVGGAALPDLRFCH